MEFGVLVLSFSFDNASMLTAGISAGAMEKASYENLRGVVPECPRLLDVRIDNRSLLNVALRLDNRSRAERFVPAPQGLVSSLLKPRYLQQKDPRRLFVLGIGGRRISHKIGFGTFHRVVQ